MDKQTKLSWVALRQQVAQRSGLDEKQVKLFMDSLIRQMTQAMVQNESVRINGLGTFRTQEVQERKSVHIQTGETITIPAYQKLTFASEASLKSTLNPIAPTGTPVPNPMQHLSEQADEIVGLLADLGQSTTEPVLPKEDEDKDEVEDQIEDKVEDKVEVEKKEEDFPVIPEEKPQPVIPEEKPRRGRPWLVVGGIMTTVCILLLIGYFLLQDQFGDWLQSLIGDETTEVEQIMDETAEADMDLEASAAEWDAGTEETNDTDLSVYTPDYSRLITTEHITPGSRLAWIAKKYYGNRELWVFLYDANKDHLTHPSRILIGTPIRVPVLDEQLLDTDNPETQALMRKMKEEFIGHSFE